MSQRTVEKVEMENSENVHKDKEKFPKAVPFILSNIFFERLASGGIFGEFEKKMFRKIKFKILIFAAILSLYINQKLNFDTNSSTAIFHVNDFLLYFSSIIGAIVADKWLGLFRTISLMTLVSSIGAGVISVAAIEPLELPIK